MKKLDLNPLLRSQLMILAGDREKHLDLKRTLL